jgi:phosphatidylinositol-3-phosphatase
MSAHGDRHRTAPCGQRRRARRRSVTAVAAIATVALSAGCGQTSAQAPPAHGAVTSLRPVSALPRSHTSRVMVVLMENEEYSDVIGSSQAPYITALAGRYGLMTNSFGIRHPSLPNYIALTSGSTQGIASDCTDCVVSARNIVDQLEGAGISWGAYLEDLPSPCFLGASSGLYVKRHNPFAYYTDIVRSRKRCERMVGFGRLHSDLRNDRLPRYVWISPNLCNDGHDCPIGTADRFLARTMPALLHELGPHGFLVLTWDEGDTDNGCCGVAAGGRIPTIVAGPDVRRRARSSTPIDDYGVLAGIEEAFGLGRLGGAADARNGRLAPLFARAPHLR